MPNITCQQRVHMCRVIERMNRNAAYCDRLAIRNTSTFKHMPCGTSIVHETAALENRKMHDSVTLSAGSADRKEDVP